MSGFSLSPEAWGDLDEIHACIAADNPSAADQVLEAAFSTFSHLAQRPELGRLRRFSHSLLTDFRSFGVRGFTNYVIFYRSRAAQVEIVRVLHGAQDFDAIFGSD